MIDPATLAVADIRFEFAVAGSITAEQHLVGRHGPRLRRQRRQSAWQGAGRDGWTEQKALRAGAAVATQELQLLDGLDAFGQHLEPEDLAECDDRRDQLGIGRILRQVADETY